MRSWIWVMTAVAAAALSAGCGRNAARQDPEAVADQIVNDALGMTETGNVAGALAHLESGLATMRDPQARSRLFAFEIGLRLNQGDLEGAQARTLQALAANNGAILTLGTLGMIEEQLVQQEAGYEAVLAWCDRLEAVGLSGDLAAGVLGNRLNALLELGRHADVMALLEGPVWALPDAAAEALCNRVVQAAIGQRRLEEAQAAIDLVARQGAARPGMPRLAAGLRIDLALAREQRTEALDLLIRDAALFEDGRIAARLDRITRPALAAGQLDEADRLAERALEALADWPAARARAAALWLMRARESADLAMGLDRLRKLESLELPPAVLVNGVGALSGLTLAPATPADAVAAMLAFVAALKPRVTEERDRALLAGVQLDAGFRASDYAFLVRVLEEGVPGHDTAWHETMLNKVKAHQALQNGRVDEAIERFRTFMATIAAQEEPGHRDPVTEERVTRPMILGFNARRIGDILKQAGRIDEADRVYTEATGYYEEALAGFAETDPERKTVAGILGELKQAASKTP